MKYWPPYGATDPDAGWVNGNPAIGSRGSIIDCRAIEQAQREIVSAISDAGITPSDADLHQLARAIQSGGLTYADDTGTSGSIVVALSPSPLSYLKGMRFSCKLGHDIPGATVCNVNGLGQKPVINSDGSALTLGQFKAGAMVCLEYDGAALQVVSGAGSVVLPQRTLTQNVDYYVNPTTGSDSYDGTSATVGGGHGPFATITKALSVVSGFAPSTYGATIHLSAGNHNCGGTSFSTAFWAHCPVSIVGAGSTQTYIYGTANTILAIVGPNRYTVSGFEIRSTSTYSGGPTCLAVTYGAVLTIGSGIVFGGNSSVSIAHFLYVSQGMVNITGSLGLKGNATGGIFVVSGSGAYIYLIGPTVTIQSAITVGFFALAINAGFIGVDGTSPATFVNPSNVTGKRYDVSYNAVINTQGRGTSYFPGTVAGTTSTGGQYG